MIISYIYLYDGLQISNISYLRYCIFTKYYSFVNVSVLLHWFGFIIHPVIVNSPDIYIMSNP